MILDKTENAGTYLSIHPAFKKAFEFMLRGDTAAIKEGRRDIEGDNLYALVSFPEGAGREQARLEAHRKYIDIQLCVKGEDVIGWRPRKECRVVSSKYSPEKDCEFFSDVPAAWLGLKPGYFAIFFPDDAHAPLAGEGEVHKIVVKVAV